MKDRVVVCGLGYVGLPLLELFSETNLYECIGLDLDEKKIDSYNRGVDIIEEIGDSRIQLMLGRDTRFVSKYTKLEPITGRTFYIICVPTPINENHVPQYDYLQRAVISISNFMDKSKDIIISESTVEPGAFRKIINQYTKCVKYFGYASERVAPSTSIKMEDINKVISGNNDHAIEGIFYLYKDIINAEVYVAPSIEVAEASKMLENIQRDVNIALVNEFSTYCGVKGINVHDVIDMASTKHNFYNVRPGLVGGGCISTDPYFVINDANKNGVTMKMTKIARDINEYDTQGRIIDTIDWLVEHKVESVLFLGATYKENCKDMNNSKNMELYERVKYLYRDSGTRFEIYDPYIDGEKPYLKEYDVVVVCLAHDEFFKYKDMIKQMAKCAMIDITGKFRRMELRDMCRYYSL